jgi:hypothetical protein
MLYADQRDDTIARYARSWQHSLQHLTIDDTDSTCWFKLLSMDLPRLRTFQLTRYGGAWASADGRMVCERILREVQTTSCPR